MELKEFARFMQQGKKVGHLAFLFGITSTTSEKTRAALRAALAPFRIQYGR